VDKTEWKCSSK